MSKSSKMPLDKRIRPVYIKRNGKREVVVSDGEGNAYECGNSPYVHYEIYVHPIYLIPAEEYEFDRGLSSFDF